MRICFHSPLSLSSEIPFTAEAVHPAQEAGDPTFHKEREASKVNAFALLILHLTDVLGFVLKLALLDLHGAMHSFFVICNGDARVGLDRQFAPVPV